MRDMALELSRNPSPVNRSESPSITELIERFHRLKEERFKPKENVCIRQTAGWGHEYRRHSEPLRLQQPSSRPSSATQKMRNLVKESIVPRRRLSLPSLFRPETPPPPEELEGPDVGNMSTRKTKDEQSRVIARRYSTSHVMHEYSKRDIKELLAARRNSVDDPRPVIAKPTNTDDKLQKRWLTGEDLHFFYNLWDKQKKPKIRFQKRLPPIHSCVNNITEVDIGRPRLNTL